MKGRGRKFGQTGGGRGYGICLGRQEGGGEMFRQRLGGFRQSLSDLAYVQADF
jgi:hypothetical protein